MEQKHEQQQKLVGHGESRGHPKDHHELIKLMLRLLVYDKNSFTFFTLE